MIAFRRQLVICVHFRGNSQIRDSETEARTISGSSFNCIFRLLTRSFLFETRF